MELKAKELPSNRSRQNFRDFSSDKSFADISPTFWVGLPSSPNPLFSSQIAHGSTISKMPVQYREENGKKNKILLQRAQELSSKHSFQ